MDLPQRLKRKSQVFVESYVEGDWVHRIKRPRVDKGTGQMETADSELDDEEARAQYRADIHCLAESSEVITWSFEALVLLVLLLAEWLPMPMSGDLGMESSDEEGVENVEEGHVSK